MKNVLYFSAGLGDVIRDCFRTSKYLEIDHLTTPLRIVCASHNPYALELFQWHPNRQRISLIEAGPHYAHGLSSLHLEGDNLRDYVLAQNSISPDDLISIEGVPGQWERPLIPERVTFHAPDIKTFSRKSSDPHIFLNFDTAVDWKSVPAPLLAQFITHLTTRFPFTRFSALSRPYVKGFPADQHFVGYAYDPGLAPNFSVVSPSVPATLHCLRNSSALICGHSSLAQYSGFLETLPTIVLYPDDISDFTDPAKRGHDYTFFLSNPLFLCIPFSEMRLPNFLERVGEFLVTKARAY